MKRLFNWSLILVAFLFLAFGGFALYRLNQFHAGIDRIKKAGYPVSLTELRDSMQTDDTDFIVLWNRLAKPMTSFETEMWIDQKVMLRPVDEEMIARFEELCRAYPDVFPLIDQLSTKQAPGCIGGRDLERFLDEGPVSVGRLRICTREMIWRMRILAAQGKPDEAMEVGLNILRLCRLFQGQPMMVSHFTVSACQIMAVFAIHKLIANQQISAGLRDRLHIELEQQDSAEGCRSALIGERAFGIDTISDRGIMQIAFEGPGYLDSINREIDNIGFQPFERPKRPETVLPNWMMGLFGNLSIEPAFKQMHDINSRSISLIRSLRIISALQKHAESQQMETITQDYLVEIGVPLSMTIDTTNGDPMKIRRNSRGWIVYSVGTDLIDDGGEPLELASQKDFVLGTAD